MADQRCELQPLRPRGGFARAVKPLRAMSGRASAMWVRFVLVGDLGGSGSRRSGLLSLLDFLALSQGEAALDTADEGGARLRLLSRLRLLLLGCGLDVLRDGSALLLLGRAAQPGHVLRRHDHGRVEREGDGFRLAGAAWLLDHEEFVRLALLRDDGLLLDGERQHVGADVLQEDGEDFGRRTDHFVRIWVRREGHLRTESFALDIYFAALDRDLLDITNGRRCQRSLGVENLHADRRREESGFACRAVDVAGDDDVALEKPTHGLDLRRASCEVSVGAIHPQLMVRQPRLLLLLDRFVLELDHKGLHRELGGHLLQPIDLVEEKVVAFSAALDSACHDGHKVDVGG
mmetsp:Transcript_11965/g.27722  ORF Transcript_11965/g.27722 Transcript_11965/m.27722 type:complete len:347 (-) Transcript_11965:183-1223(-)